MSDMLLQAHVDSDGPPDLPGLLQGFLQSPDLLLRFEKVSAPFAGHQAMLLDFLLGRPALTLRHLSVTAEMLALAARLNREAEAIAWLVGHTDDDAACAPRWGREDFLNKLATSRSARSALRVLKYGAAPPLRTGAQVIAFARTLSPRYRYQKGFDRYYDFSAAPRLPVEQWREDFTVTCCIEHVLREIVRDGQGALVDDTATARTFAGLDRSRPNLLLTVDGGFTDMAKQLFQQEFKNSLLAGRWTARDRRASADDDLHGALRALQEGKSLLLAPDGVEAGAGHAIAVHDAGFPVGESAAFLAYEARCVTAWLTVTRDETGFIPVVVAAPEPYEMESYDAFKTRFMDFQAARIAEHICGDPRNLLPTEHWSRLLRNAQPQVLRHRQSGAVPAGAFKKKLKDVVDSGNAADIHRQLQSVLATPDLLGEKFDKLAPLFIAKAREGLFLDFLLANPALWLCDLPVAAKTLELAARLDREAEAIPLLRHRKGVAANGLRWSVDDYLNKYKVGGRVRLALRSLKYGDCPSLQTGRDVIDFAKELAQRCTYRSALDGYYRIAAAPRLPLDQWRREITVTHCIEHILYEYLGDRQLELVDAAAAAEAFAKLDKSRPNLLLIFHGGFRNMAKLLFSEHFPEGILISRHGTEKGRIPSRDDPRAALFTALRALQEGKSLFVAPDGTEGSLGTSIEILGTQSPVGDGAAFLAYETGCDTSWLHIARDDSRFAPVLVAAPRRLEKESYRAFKARFMDFYAERITEFVTGDPHNLLFTHRWSHVLQNAQSGAGI